MTANLAPYSAASLSATVTFDEQAYIDEALAELVELHGSYNNQDQRLVRQMASYERTFQMADAHLLMPMQLLHNDLAHGNQPSAFTKLRENASNMILKIRKDLGLDLCSRAPLIKGKQAEGTPFNAIFKEERELTRR